MTTRFTRRTFLRGAATVPLAKFLLGCGDDNSGDGGQVDAGIDAPDGPSPPMVFDHGVASGDPTPTALIIWTRISLASAPVEVIWELSTDDFSTIAMMGTVMTDADRDYTVKVDVTGLTPGTTYQYRFKASGETSRAGRAKVPVMGPLDAMKIGVTSCSSLAHGYFHAYRSLAGEEVDVVLHLGDYIYEYGNLEYGEIRMYEPPTEILSLSDYRTRYAQYRRDADLQEVHARHAFIVVWDDHEVANDANEDGAENHMPGTEGSYAARRAAAFQAHREWMPIRDGEPGKIYRKLAFGDLVDLFMLDTRHFGRDMPIPNIEDPNRQLLGAEQEEWLAAELPASTAAWKFIGQQVMMGQLPLLMNNDAWDGYPAARTRFLDLIETSDVDDVVVLTGDIHSSWGMDLTRDPQNTSTYDPATGMGSLAVELVTPGITSPGLPDAIAPDLNLEILSMNRHMKHVDVALRGYMLLDVNRTRVRASYRHWNDLQIIEPTFVEGTVGATLEVQAGTPRLIKVS